MGTDISPRWIEVVHPLFPQVVGGRVDQDPILGGLTDGWAHRRLKGSGHCITCGAEGNEEHARVEPSRTPDAPIYYALLEEMILDRDIRHRMTMRGCDPQTVEAAVRFFKQHREMRDQL